MMAYAIWSGPISVQEAKKLITSQLVREAQADLVIPKDHHRHILGVKAQKLRNLEQETSTKITVPRPEENSEIVSIKGPKEGIAQAVHRLVRMYSNTFGQHTSERFDDYI